MADGTVTMKHPDVDGYAEVSKEAFEETWSANGWEIVPEAGSPGDERSEDAPEVVEVDSAWFAERAKPVEDPVAAGLVVPEEGDEIAPDDGSDGDYDGVIEESPRDVVTDSLPEETPEA